MAEQPDRAEEGEGRPGDLRKKVMGGAALVLGATGLFLFIVGLKRKHRLDEESEVSLPPEGAHRGTDAMARHPLDEDGEEPLQAADRRPAPTRRRAPRRKAGGPSRNGAEGTGDDARPRRAPRRRPDAASRRPDDDEGD
ncbi:MAG TPA: hypothetical protein VF746_27395 [Longimicrobium sp.]|jgi:hypothetical protein